MTVVGETGGKNDEDRDRILPDPDADDAHAVIGRETVEVDGLDGAIAAAQLLARTLDMPQRPDSMMITDANGKVHYCGIIGLEAVNEERQ